MPAIMAVMIEQLDVRPGQRVLEIGVGTGYNAAILARLVGLEGRVTSVDIDEDIAEGAKDHLAQAGFPNVNVVLRDGWLGLSEEAPFDRIEATVGVWDLSPHWVEQLAPDGILVVPLWVRPGLQASIAFRKDGGALRSICIEPCGFMRLRGPHSGPEAYVQVGDWIVGMDSTDPGKVEILRSLLELPPRREPARNLSKGWRIRLALDESGAINLSGRDDWRRQMVGVFDPNAKGLALIADGMLQAFGDEGAAVTLREHLAHSAPLDLQKLSVTAVPSTAEAVLSSGWAVIRPNFSFLIRSD